MQLSEILAQYAYKTELHAHTSPASPCARFGVEDTVRIYRDKTAANTLAITNHLGDHLMDDRTDAEVAEFYLADYYNAMEMVKGSDFSVALGVEIRFQGTMSDYLVYGISPEDVEAMVPYVRTDIHTFYKAFKNDKTVILHAHPFRNGGEPTPVDAVDGIEAFNNHTEQNSRIALAAQFAREHDFVVSGGSDYHGSNHEASCLMCTKARMRDSYDIAQALLSRDVLFDIGGSTLVPYTY